MNVPNCIKPWSHYFRGCRVAIGLGLSSLLYLGSLLLGGGNNYFWGVATIEKIQ